MAKPHIAKLVTTGRWCCSMRKTEPGFGMTPREAFRDWRLQNFPTWELQHRIYLAGYAGTHGGARPDFHEPPMVKVTKQTVATHDAARDVWGICKRRMVAALVAATVLWLLWV